MLMCVASYKIEGSWSGYKLPKTKNVLAFIVFHLALTQRLFQTCSSLVIMFLVFVTLCYADLDNSGMWTRP